ncbi:MAG: MarR family winged helix-turn-helix transcriptional regulator [Pseudomonadota bacterium]
MENHESPTSVPAPAPATRTLGALLRLPYRVLAERVYARLGEAGYPEIRPMHSGLLRNIEPGGTRVTTLAERAQMTKQSMSAMVDELVRAGYLSVAPDPADGRAKRVTLTARGIALQATLVRLSTEVEAEFAELIGPDRFAQLKELLTAWAEAYEAPSG